MTEGDHYVVPHQDGDGRFYGTHVHDSLDDFLAHEPCPHCYGPRPSLIYEGNGVQFFCSRCGLYSKLVLVKDEVKEVG